jgi:hypothetical protein
VVEPSDVTRPCCVCGEHVPYTDQRRKCKRCRRWCHHGRCSVDTSLGYPHLPMCHPCLRAEPGQFFRKEAVDIVGGERFRDSAEVLPVMFVLWCLVFGRSAGPEAEKLGIPAGKIPEWDRRLEEGQCWVEGILAMEAEAWESPGSFNVVVLLFSLAAEGLVERRWTPEGPVVSIPDEAAEVGGAGAYDGSEETTK